MVITRRGMIGGALAATAGLGTSAALSRAGAAESEEGAKPAAGDPGDVVGKISVGYQGWFACTGDGSPINSWWHWSRDRFQSPSPSNTTIKSWPHMGDYQQGYTTAYANPNSGRPAQLFSSWDQQTVDTHFRWMRENAIDTAALQRFNPFGDEGPTRDGMAQKARQAAEANGRKFYIMYDVSGWTSMQSQIKQDWTEKMKAYTASGAYARQNGKPVVCIWGFGFNDDGRPFEPGPCKDVIDWFRAQGCYVIGGVPTHWRTGTEDSRAGFSDVYHAFHMISPWMVGRISSAAQSDDFFANVNSPDKADCDAHGIDYQPCVMPGRSAGTPSPARRLHVAAVLQHGAARLGGHLHIHVRRVQRGKSDRQDSGDRGGCAVGFGNLGARRGRYGLLARLLPPADR